MATEQTVLAVDDEPANQRAVSRALSGDCRVLTASSGSEALDIMVREPVALVISDQRMPGMSGAAFLAEVVERHPQVIRIALTGYTDVDTLLEVVNRGHIFHFLGKPWQISELRQVVRHGLERFAAVAERLRLIEDLRVACVRAQREAEQGRRLLALTAHELGTPLHILLNVIELVRDGGVPQTALGWIDAGERAVEWLARGVRQMRDAARISERRFPLRLQAVAIGPLLTSAVEELRAEASGRALDIALELQTMPIVVNADPRWLHHAVAALLSNAVRFTPDGGRVRLRSRSDTQWGEIEVEDTGIGIAAAHLADAFEPFSSAGGDLLLHGSGRYAFGARGLGLGLAMVKRIAEAHGGSVGVESAPEIGSRFSLRLPLATG